MNSFDLLTSRQSNPSLIAPAPTNDNLDFILSAGMRVPDHGGLTPWQFTVVTGQGLDRLSELFVKTFTATLTAGSETPLTDNDPKQIKINKLKKMPYRAPMIIVVSTRYQPHDKVPKQEQLITAGCCVHAMQLAAFSLGYGAMWRTGELAYNKRVNAGLNIKEDDDIVGFLYLGTASKELAIKEQKDCTNYVSYWL